ncbi:hypothetical protein LIER_12810 [Lithospermum erythrorhizon]|uniref:Uncharacterized protein n=1 Tax=Lithospermum erythrorhizon TaxID=34254 RepID=A0AAV3PVA1_LITER
MKTIKQAQWWFRPELVSSIEAKVNKLIEKGFIREVQYPMWLANIVPVRKKNWKSEYEELTTFQTPKGVYSYSYALWVEECRSHLLESQSESV